MGIDYQLRCRKCYEQLMGLSGEEAWNMWKTLDPDFDFDVDKNPVHINHLVEWIRKHREHGKIDFIIE